MPKTGRPSTYSKAIAGRICERLVEGESTRQICADKDMPSLRTVMQWLERHEDFAQQYARAREMQAEAMAADIVAIADEEADPQRARVRVDARKWVAAKLLPRRYGDRVAMEHTGKDGGPIQYQDMSDVERAQRLAHLMAQRGE